MTAAPTWQSGGVTLYQGDVLDVLRELTAESVQCVVTSPPYWGLRDYGVGGQIGLEPTPEQYVARMVAVFAEVRRVLRSDGTLWLNLGDVYAHGGACGGGSPDGSRAARATDAAKQQRMKYRVPPGLKEKDLTGIPWRVALALQADGWYLRQDIIWHKPNPMPESVRDRCTKAHEYLFLLTKAARYKYDAAAIREAGANTVYTRSRYKYTPSPGKKHDANQDTNVNSDTFAKYFPSERNKRSVWTVPTQPYPEAHFATFPTALVEPCILAGTKPGDTVLDPFIGSGTTALVAVKHGCKCTGIDLNSTYLDLAAKRVVAEAAQTKLPFGATVEGE